MDLLCPGEKELSGFIKHFKVNTRGRKSFLQTQAWPRSPRSSQLLQSEHPQIPSQPPALAWQERQQLPYKQDPAPTANITQGMIISMAAHCNMVNRRRMHREQRTLNEKASPSCSLSGGGECEHCRGCRGVLQMGNTVGFAKQNRSQGLDLVGFSPLSKQPGSFPGALTAFSWTGLYCAPVTVQISVPPAPGVFPGWGGVPLAVEKSLPPGKCR